jgi:FkbM family methyltransferase
MSSWISRHVRSLTLPLLHRWQYFWDVSRGKWREFRDGQLALKRAIPILKDIHGVRFVLYPWDRSNLLALLRHSHDLNEFQAIPWLLNRGDTALDVGANVGFSSVLLGRLCGPSGRIFAFEPVPDTHWRLRETLALNRCDNVTAVQAAVCDKLGTARMNLFDPQFAEWNGLGGHAMRGPDGSVISPTQSVDVPATTLDDFCTSQGIDHIHFLKVDVEGFEVAVFQGAKRLLREHRVDYICFEISQDPLKGAGIESRNVFEALELHGYTAYQFDRASRRFHGPVTDTAETWANFFASWKDLSKLDETASPPQKVQRPQEAVL